MILVTGRSCRHSRFSTSIQLCSELGVVLKQELTIISLPHKANNHNINMHHMHVTRYASPEVGIYKKKVRKHHRPRRRVRTKKKERKRPRKKVRNHDLDHAIDQEKKVKILCFFKIPTSENIATADSCCWCYHKM